MPPSGVVHRRRLTDELGEWRHHRELTCDPEADLWRRVHEAGYRFSFVPRLSAVKFPAAYRKDVYRIRPCHEQAEWARRILQEDDFEAVELGRMYAGVEDVLLSDPSRSGRPGLSHQQRTDERRTFKGL